MARRSLQASAPGIQAIKQALKRKQGGQTYLAGAVRCSRQTIWSLLQGNPIYCDVFMAVCKELGLSWEDIAEPEPAEPEPESGSKLDEIVQEARDRLRPLIQERCGTMRVLDMNQPIELGEIYTHVNILEKISGRRRLELAELLGNVSREEVDRFSLGMIAEQRVPGLEAVEKYSKLMILGKPGAGKTTFLKHLAIQCIGGKFQGDRVPLFITLKDFAEAEGRSDLLGYIESLVKPTNPGRAIGRSPRPTETPTQQILNNGRALILLDGLDEVRETDVKRVLRQIQQFSEHYSRNTFVITCRIAAREYTFEKFTEVEVADFDDEQIADVSGKWFRCRQDEVKAERFLQKLQENPPIRELASSPLLLTLLCLVFEDSGDFPANRAELYQNGVDVLLKKWDVNRNIERDQIYKKLSLKRKEDLLSQIAWRTFEAGNYFFKQKDLEQQIREFIEHLPGASTDEEALNLDSEVVLKSIEAQHGLFVERAYQIYSFSHLTFHEYFAAREAKEKAQFIALIQHLADKRWREVTLLTVGMLTNADELLVQMKQQIDRRLARDERLQEFLNWVTEKAKSVNVSYKPTAIRAFYFSLALDRAFAFTFARARARARELTCDLALDLALDLTLDLDLALDLTLTFALAFALDLTLALDLALDLTLALDHLIQITQSDPLFKLKLEILYSQLLNPKESWEVRRQWWKSNGQAWVEQLRIVMIEHRNIGRDWQFSDAQIEKLQQYYAANKLLVDCLNSDCYVSRHVRQEIEDTLLLPIAEIENRQQSL